MIQKIIKAIHHYYLISRCGLFDRDYYLETYPDVRNSEVDPLWHFIQSGWKEGKNPSPDFDTAYYLRENKDIRMGRINPLVHYIQFGKAEDRPPNRSLSKDPFTYYS
jgi:hypothetical protein